MNFNETNYIDQQTKIIGNTKIGKNCKIINSVLEDSIIGDNVTIINSTITKSSVGANTSVGPYAHIRGNSKIAENVRVGNFVEIKNSIIAKGTKIAHLAYVGDAEVGENVNIGCGVIFANYDGKNKHRTIVGNRVFIGSNSNLVAPLFIEDDSFIAAGTTVTNNIGQGEFCIGRVRNEIKKGILNMYAQNFSEPLKYFGTDGIRGVYGKKLTDDLAEKVGVALTKLTQNPKVIIGRDTRPSGEQLLHSLAGGLEFGGAEVVDLGIVPTSCVSYLTKILGYDFGVMITASHNPSEYNGIKIFNSNGYKLNETQEGEIEKIIDSIQPPKFIAKNIVSAQKRAYLELLCNAVPHTKKLDVFLDCANGSASIIAPKVFKKLGHNVFVINDDGEINKDAGVLDEKIFSQKFTESGAEIGFCFDGDADRVMCITKNGVLDGDRILYILAKFNNEKFAVGTIMTNFALEKHLSNIGTKLIRTDVGDKYIAREMKSKKYHIGAEQSGHVIISKFMQTGDGILTAIVLASLYQTNKELFDEALSLKMFPVFSTAVVTENKKVIKSDEFLNFKAQLSHELISGRIVVRPSGTEPKIRITVEDENLENCQKIAEKIKNYIENKINNN